MKRVVISAGLFLSLVVTVGYAGGPTLPACSAVPKTGTAAVCGYWWQKQNVDSYNACIQCAKDAATIVVPNKPSSLCNGLLNPSDYSGPVACSK